MKYGIVDIPELKPIDISITKTAAAIIIAVTLLIIIILASAILI